MIVDGDIQVWVKELSDGGKALGVFNLGSKMLSYSVDLRNAGVNPTGEMWDLWRQKSLKKAEDKVTFTVPSHGVMLVKIK